MNFLNFIVQKNKIEHTALREPPDALLLQGQARICTDKFAFTKVACDPAKPWITVAHHFGPDTVISAYAQLRKGQGDPRVEHMLSLSRAQ